jgi:predicted P-loop ATPase
VEECGFDPGRNHIQDAIQSLCHENTFDPVVEYLAGLKWDGIDRLDSWLITYLGAEDTELNREIGGLILLAMVRRARQPGCKFDQIVVLEGPEGTLKSSALQVLAGPPEFFSDQTILGLSDQQQQERLRGKWVYEIADLANMKRAEVEQVKAFASRTHDRARPAYGRSQVDLPRRGIIAATTNETTYLKSQTGNRRFWPVPTGITGKIDIEALKRDRDQLFAEASAREAEGASLVLPPRLWGKAGETQETRVEYDPWIDKLAGLRGEIAADGQERVASDDVLSNILCIPAAQQTDVTTKRLANVMRRLKWDGPKQIRFGKANKRGYWRLPDEDEDPV